MGRFVIITLVGLICAPMARGVSVGTTSDFQDGTTEGWSSGNALTNIANGGPAGAGDRYLDIESFGGNLATFNLTSPWPGDYAAAGVTSIDLDMLNPNESPMEMRIVAFFNTSDRWTSTVSHIVPADNAWHHFSFSLKAADLTHVGGTSTYAQLMAAVERIMVRYDPGTASFGGSSFTGRLDVDNVTATAPEPGSLSVLSIAGLLAARRNRR